MKYLFISLLFIPIIILVKSIASSMIIYTCLSILICGILYLGILIIIKDGTLIYLKDVIARKIKRNNN